MKKLLNYFKNSSKEQRIVAYLYFIIILMLIETIFTKDATYLIGGVIVFIYYVKFIFFKNKKKRDLKPSDFIWVKKMRNKLVILILSSMLIACSSSFVAVKDTGPINPMLIGGKSNAMKFPVNLDQKYINVKNPRIKSIIRVANQSKSATIIILYPPESLKVAEKYYSIFNINGNKVMRPIQAAILDSEKQSDSSNIYIYVTFTPILVPNALEEARNEK